MRASYLYNGISILVRQYLYTKIFPRWPESSKLTLWGRAMHICISKLTIIGSDNGLLPGWRHAIIQTNDGILLIEPLGANFSEI